MLRVAAKGLMAKLNSNVEEMEGDKVNLLLSPKSLFVLKNDVLRLHHSKK